jgi:hypothetical protein
MEEPSPTPVLRDWPWGPWVVGSIFGSFGALMVLSSLGTGDTSPLLIGTIVSGIGTLIVALPSVLTIRVDRKSGFLNLTYRSLLTKKVKEIPLRQVESVDVDHYGVAITERDGQVMPLRPHARRRDWAHSHRVATRLRELIGVGGSHGDLDLRKAVGMLTGHDERVNQQTRHLHETLTSSHPEMSQTVGVSGIIQTAGMARSPVTRWFSPDSKTNGTFLYLVQISAFRKTFGGMIGKLSTRGRLGEMLARASMALHGFVGNELPGSNLARRLALDPLLEGSFLAFSPNAAEARRILNPSVAEALADWAARHPLETNQAGNGPAPLVVLFSPNGVYAATRSELDPARLAELAATAAELVKAQQRKAS